MFPAQLPAQLQAIADRDVQAWPAMPARLVHVLAPSRGLDLEMAAGVADRATGTPMVPGSRFRIASVTKTFVGAAALRLVEGGQVGSTIRLTRWCRSIRSTCYVVVATTPARSRCGI